jgi:hypothetical protein
VPVSQFNSPTWAFFDTARGCKTARLIMSHRTVAQSASIVFASPALVRPVRKIVRDLIAELENMRSSGLSVTCVVQSKLINNRLI